MVEGNAGRGKRESDNAGMECGYLEGANERIVDEPLGIKHLDIHNLVTHLIRTLLEVEVDDLVGGRGRG